MKEYYGLKFPKPLGYVNDYKGILTDLEKNDLESYLTNYEHKNSREVVVVIVDSIKPYNNILDFGKNLGNEWGIGKVNKNNGLLLVVNIAGRDIGISTALATEKLLTDSICQIVIDQTIIPEFTDQQYYDGIKNGLTDLMARWK